MSVAFRINCKERVSSTPLPDEGLGEEFHLEGTNGSLVLLIHGLTGTPHEMRSLANSLNRQGYAVVTPRLKNHGQPLEILQETPWQDFHQTIKDAFNANKDKYGQVFVAGLSMGALLGLLLAGEWPDKVTGVSCLSPTLFYDGWNTPWYRCFLPLLYLLPPLERCLYFKEEPPYGIKNEAVRKRVHRYYSQASLDNIGNVGQYGYPYFPVVMLHRLQRLVRYLIPRLKEVSSPVQLIQARDDDMTSIRNSQFVYNRVSSEIKEVILLEDSYHVITADQQREQVADEVIRFFGKLKKS